ncbi:uncharacterized protein LOC144750160 [Ciona intestinalis]
MLNCSPPNLAENVVEASIGLHNFLVKFNSRKTQLWRYNQKLRKVWILSINRAVKKATGKDWCPTENDVICYDHFTEKDYKPKLCDAMKNKQLKSGAVPTIFKFKQKKQAERTTKNSIKSFSHAGNSQPNPEENFDSGLLEAAEIVVQNKIELDDSMAVGLMIMVPRVLLLLRQKIVNVSVQYLTLNSSKIILSSIY